jgi:hypothetical protein
MLYMTSKEEIFKFFAKLEGDESFAAKIVHGNGHKVRISGATV